jgi:hypothetical protein
MIHLTPPGENERPESQIDFDDYFDTDSDQNRNLETSDTGRWPSLRDYATANFDFIDRGKIRIQDGSSETIGAPSTGIELIRANYYRAEIVAHIDPQHAKDIGMDVDPEGNILT